MIADLVEAILRAWSTKHVTETRQFSLYGIPFDHPQRRIYTAAFQLAYPRSYFPPGGEAKSSGRSWS